MSVPPEWLSQRVDDGSAIAFHDGSVWLSNDGTPVSITVEGGGFSDAERAAIIAEIAGGWMKPYDIPPGDGTKVTITVRGGSSSPAFYWEGEE